MPKQPKPATTVPANRIEQPLDRVEWVSRDTLRPNSYNPNRQAPPEAKLLKISLLENGWTQPIVAFDDGEIVDGEHRWRTSGIPEVFAMTGGMVPVVRLSCDKRGRILATIRHNRARGEHAVVNMAAIVRDLIEDGMAEREIRTLLQMESEEVQRLAMRAGMPVNAGSGEFGKAWVPGDREGAE